MPDLEFRASYFKKHNEAGDQFSADLSEQHAKALTARPPDAAVNATLLVDWIGAFKLTAGILEDSMIARGVVATRDVGDKLEATCRQYIQTEAANAAEARRILAAVGY